MTVVDDKIAGIREDYADMPGFPSLEKSLRDYFDRTIEELKLQVRAEVAREILAAHAELKMEVSSEAHYGLGLLEAARIAVTID